VAETPYAEERSAEAVDKTPTEVVSVGVDPDGDGIDAQGIGAVTDGDGINAESVTGSSNRHGARGRGFGGISDGHGINRRGVGEDPDRNRIVAQSFRVASVSGGVRAPGVG